MIFPEHEAINPASGPRKPIADPYSILSHAQEEAAAIRADHSGTLTELLRFLIHDTDDLRVIGRRALLAASRIRPDLFHDGTLHSSMTPEGLLQLEGDFESAFGGASPLAGTRAPLNPRAGAVDLFPR